MQLRGKYNNYFNRLISLYERWEGNVRPIKNFLEQIKNYIDFEELLSEFSNYINGAYGAHPKRYQRTNLFWGSYYVSATPAFKKLNETIQSFFPKKTIFQQFWDISYQVVNYSIYGMKQMAQSALKNPGKVFLVSLYALSPQKNFRFKITDTETNTSFFNRTYPIINEKNIIVCFSNSPSLGDQGNTLNVMNYIRGLGYERPFEVVYANPQKVILLFGLPENIPSIYENKNKNIIFTEINTFESNPNKTEVNLGFIVLRGTPICSPSSIHATTFIEFSPFFESTKIYVLENKPIHDEGSAHKFFIMPRMTYQEAKSFLFESEQGEKLLTERPAFIPFLNGLESNAFNLLPAYGYSLKFPLANEYATEGPSPKNILQTIAGARYAQLMGGENFHKPLIIAVFDFYEAHATRILELIHSDHWGRYEREDSQNARLLFRELGLMQVLNVTSLSSPHATQQINSLTQNNILILSMGRLPKIVFAGIFSHAAPNILPRVLEGAGTENELIATGVPYFRCSGRTFARTNWNLPFEMIADEQLRHDFISFYNTQDGYCSSAERDFSPRAVSPLQIFPSNQIYQMLGQFIIASTDPQSPFSRYFSQLQAHARRPESDRVRSALDQAENILRRMRQSGAS